jgi:DNA helicase-2/ATP-dependent DNA helicase PcrA
MSLNNEQKLAVTGESASALVLAGAGAGKTKVLVARLAHHIQQGISFEQLLAVTFTNKAAGEMKERLEHQLDCSVNGLWMGTFHSLAYRMLCVHTKERFKVISQNEQLSVVKRILTELELEVDAKLLVNYINTQKDAALRANPDAFELFGRMYCIYETVCRDDGLVDFGELLLRSYELLRDSSSIRNYYQARFEFVLVDEFQDTNIIQYEWLKLLTERKQNLFVVGDDDQSIYGWRGAKVENMTTFQTSYVSHNLVKLEQNYRCTNNILNAANAVIANNVKRLGKTLWTEANAGELIDIYSAKDEIAESDFVIEQIKQWVNAGNSLNDVAILYRCNFQSSAFEDKLLAEQLPFQVSKGFRFYDRQEIRLVLAYLRVIAGDTDSLDFNLLSSTPSKGVGKRTRELIADYAAKHQRNHWQAAECLISTNALPSRQSTALAEFLARVEAMKVDTENLSLVETLRVIMNRSGIVKYYRKAVDCECEERIDNLKALLTIAGNFTVDPTINLSERDQFIIHACLSSGDEKPKGVQLMTLHSSKGLEFGCVFLVGLETGLFPAKTAPLEEERRLMYVGITRAKTKLVITYSRQRCLFGNTVFQKPSRFLSEIPLDLINIVKDAPIVTASASYPKGSKVFHQEFGEGIVVGKDSELINVEFDDGNHWLAARYLPPDVFHSIN